jgi:nucleoside-diphosphate-sugar epimerase
MVGDGENRKSMAYVGNVAAFLHYALTFKQGIHIYNYIDKPDFTMNQLVSWINQLLGRSDKVRIRLPYWCGVLIGKCFDLMAALSGKKLPISAIRVKKFCATSVYESGVNNTGFVPPVSLQEAIDKTIKYEFIDTHNDKQVFYSE